MKIDKSNFRIFCRFFRGTMEPQALRSRRSGACHAARRPPSVQGRRSGFQRSHRSTQKASRVIAKGNRDAVSGINVSFQNNNKKNCPINHCSHRLLEAAFISIFLIELDSPVQFPGHESVSVPQTDFGLLSFFPSNVLVCSKEIGNPIFLVSEKEST